MEGGGSEDDQERRLRERVRRQVACEERAFCLVERLLDNPISEELLLSACQLIQPHHYADVVEERAIIKHCGYPPCSNPLGKIPSKKYHISTRHNKIYDITERKNFCSDQCLAASRFLARQIPSSPLWMRDKEPPSPITLLARQHTKGEKGDEIIGLSLLCPEPELHGLRTGQKHPATPPGQRGDGTSPQNLKSQELSVQDEASQDGGSRLAGLSEGKSRHGVASAECQSQRQSDRAPAGSSTSALPSEMASPGSGQTSEGSPSASAGEREACSRLSALSLQDGSALSPEAPTGRQVLATADRSMVDCETPPSPSSVPSASTKEKHLKGGMSSSTSVPTAAPGCPASTADGRPQPEPDVKTEPDGGSDGVSSGKRSLAQRESESKVDYLMRLLDKRKHLLNKMVDIQDFSSKGRNSSSAVSVGSREEEVRCEGKGEGSVMRAAGDNWKAASASNPVSCSNQLQGILPDPPACVPTAPLGFTHSVAPSTSTPDSAAGAKSSRSECKGSAGNAEHGSERTRQGGERTRQGGEEVRQGGEEVRQGGEKFRQEGEKFRQGGEKARQGGEKVRQGGEKARQGGEKVRQGGEKVRQGGEGARQGDEKVRQGGEKARQGGEGAKQGSERARQGGEKARQGGEKARQGGERAKQGSERARQSERGFKCYSKKTTGEISLGPLQVVVRQMQEWVTPDTRSFVLARQVRGSTLNRQDLETACLRLEAVAAARERSLEQLEELRSQEEEMPEGRKPSRPPTYDLLAEQTQEFSIKVQQFYGGSHPESEELPVRDKNEGKKKVFLPPVDCHDQMTLRRRIVLERLDKVIPELLSSLSLLIQDVTAPLRELVYTFSLASDNITFRPPQWMLVALLLLHMLSRREEKIQAGFASGSSVRFVSILLSGIGQSLADLESATESLLRPAVGEELDSLG